MSITATCPDGSVSPASKTTTSNGWGAPTLLSASTAATGDATNKTAASKPDGSVHLAPIGLAVLRAAGGGDLDRRRAASAISWTAALVYLAASNALLLIALRRRRTPHLGSANVVTATRSALVAIIRVDLGASMVIASLAAHPAVGSRR